MYSRPAGFTAAIALVVGLALTKLGLDASEAVVAAISGLAIGLVSIIAPRDSGITRPVGLTAAAATVLVWLASLKGIEVDQTTALAIVSVPAIIVSIFTPRRDRAGDLEAELVENESFD